MTGVQRRLLLETTVVFLVALTPRLVGIGTFLTADEKQWVSRGVEYVRALREFRFNDTLQTTHPGIPTLWITGLATATVSRATGEPFTFDALLRFARVSQWSLAVGNSVLVTLLFLALRRLILGASTHASGEPQAGVRPKTPPLALLAALVIALDPFLVGHGKIVHVDALLAEFTVLTIVLLLCAEQGSRWALAGSAVAGALAILSKLPGVVVVPMAAILFFSRRAAFRRAEAAERLRLLGQWLVILVATVLLLWPGLLWVPDPLGNVKTVKRDLLVAIETPHHMADDYILDAGHYLATLLSRSTIPTLVGFLLFLFVFLPGAVRKRRPANAPGGKRETILSVLGISPRTAGILVGFVALFLVGMMLGAKKGDRYLLPVFPVLDVLATAGVFGVLRRLRPSWPLFRTARIAGLLLLVPLVIELVRLGPYALAYYNPLFPPNFSQELGWGEGLDQVARFLNGLKEQRDVAASWYPEELRALVQRPVQSLGAHEQLRTGYVVLYRNMFGRPPSHPANDFLDEYYQKQTPVFTAIVHGLPYAWVYRKPAYWNVVGELTPQRVLVAELPVSGASLEGIEVFLATYFARATTGELVAHVRSSVQGPDLAVARYAVRADDDNRWVPFRFFPALDTRSLQSVVIVLTAEGTRSGNAPTVRFAPEYPGARPYAVVRRDRLNDGVLTESGNRGLIAIRALGGGP